MEVWVSFLKGVERAFQRVDKVTVRAVELRAPGVSTLDAQFLRGQVLGGAIFSGFSDQERAIIWEKIRAFKGIIPSLSKFFQDIHLLRACVDGLKWLVTVPRDRKETLFTALEDWYQGNGETLLIQTTETTFESATASPTLCKKLGVLVLVAFAMRHHQNLPKLPVKKNLKTIPRAKADREVLQQFAALAFQLGFKSPEIKALKGDLDPLPILDTQKPIPLLVTTGSGESIKQRCGFPHTDTFEEDRKYLFLHNLCEERDETGEGITSFFVLKSWFTAFFNPPQWVRQVWSTESSNPPPPQAHHQHVDEEDVNMGDSRPRSPDQRDQEQNLQIIDTDDRTQETIQSMQQRMSWIAKEANRKLEMEQTQDREAPEGEYQVIEGLENYRIPRQETPEEDDNDLLDKEKENLYNARILDSDTAVIHLKERVEDRHDDSKPYRHDNSKPAEEWEWTELGSLEVPIGDPGGMVERGLKTLFEDSLVEPYTSYLRRLQFKDCYNAAMADKDHTLYLIKPPWIPSNFVPTTVFPSTLFPPKQFAWEEEPNRRGKGPNRRRIFASLQAQEGAGLERTKFSFAPPDIPQLSLPSQQELVESEAQAHSDKIGSPDQPGKDGPRQIPQLPLPSQTPAPTSTCRS